MTHWGRKFRNAFRGIRLGMIGQSSFVVHVPVAGMVFLAAHLLRCSAWQWAVLAVLVAQVLTLELFNSALETVVRGLSPGHNESVGRGLDIASGAVLVASLFAAAIGGGILATQAWTVLVGN